MTVEQFLESSKVAPDWKDILRLEVLSGCSNCERRLIHNGILRENLVVLRVQETSGKTVATMVLCEACANDSLLR